jgi:hypothetical protein
MKKYLIILFIGLLYPINCIIAQNLKGLEQIKEMNNNIQRSKQVKAYLTHGHSKNYLYDGLFIEECRSKVLRNLQLSDYERDSLVFVEFCSMTSPGYTCSFYKSGDTDYQTLYINKGDLKEEYLKSNKSLTQYIVNEIKKGNLDLVFEKGKKSNLYPEDYVHIIIAKRQGKDYKIESYTTKYFILDNKPNSKESCNN